MIDMSWGSPAFLFDYWEKNPIKPHQVGKLLTTDKMAYKIGTEELTKTAIKSLHILQNNAITENKYVAVGNGATQILHAVMYILGKPVYAYPPHFSRFPTIANLATVPFSYEDFEVQIVTIPNNPDNSEHQWVDNDKLKIYDLSYNWNQYTDPIIFDEEIMIFSLSKATGHSSTRIGWLLTTSEELARGVENFIELTTGGVSIEAQNQLISVINNQAEAGLTVFQYGRKELDDRWNKIHELNLPFEVLNHNGMFMWCKGQCPEGVIAMGGENFMANESFFRLNIGCSKENFDAFINKFSK